MSRITSSRLTWLTFAAAGCLATLTAFLASGFVGSAVDATLDRHIKGEITRAEVWTAMLVQSGLLLVVLLGAVWGAGRLFDLRSKWTLLWVANPVSVALAYLLYVSLRLNPPRGYYPSWLPELVRRGIWFSVLAFVTAIMIMYVRELASRTPKLR